MLKHVLSLFLVGIIMGTLAHGPVRAQGGSAASETRKQQLRGRYLQNDTAQAIISLYSRRQAGGASWIVAAALSGLRLAAAGNATTTGGGYVVQDDRNSTGAVLLAALPFVGYGVGKLAHYSNGNLERVLTDYAAGQPLPRSLRRKLKRRFFAQPIINYKPAN